jgi:hypothetical protein
MKNETKLIVDVEKNIYEIVELTDEEQAIRNVEIANWEKAELNKQAEAEAKAQAKAQLLAQLGITEEQAKLLLL